MEKTEAISAMSALAQPTRLAAFSLLAQAGPEGVTAGRLAAQTGTPANTMSAHLLILTHAGLVTSRRQGRNIYYEATPGAIEVLVMFLRKNFSATKR